MNKKLITIVFTFMCTHHALVMAGDVTSVSLYPQSLTQSSYLAESKIDGVAKHSEINAESSISHVSRESRVGANVDSSRAWLSLVESVEHEVSSDNSDQSKHSEKGRHVDMVPLPAAGWLLGSALLGFVVLSNRRRV